MHRRHLAAATLAALALHSTSASAQILSDSAWIQGAAGPNFGVGHVDLDTTTGELSAWCDYQGLIGELLAVELLDANGALLGEVDFSGPHQGFTGGSIALGPAAVDDAAANGVEMRFVTSAFPAGEMGSAFGFPAFVSRSFAFDAGQVVDGPGPGGHFGTLHMTRSSDGRVFFSGGSPTPALPFTAIELRGPAYFGEVGPLVLDLEPFDSSHLGDQFLIDLPPGTLDAASLQDLDDGFLYVLTRTAALPGGALRNPADAQLTAAMQAVFTPGLETLAAQAMFPPTSRAEMRGETGENELADIADGDFTGIWEAIVDRFVAIPTYANMLTDAYPGTALVDFHMGHLANALAAFQATELHSVDSPFQRFLAGDDGALTTPQLRGALQYFGPQGRCSVCHVGPLLSDFRYHNIGMPQLGPGKGDGVGSDDDFGREQVTGAAAERYRFRTPSLLNVELTAPFGHAGQFSTLESMVRHYRNVTNSLNTYDIMEHVSDTDLISTQLANESDVLANLSGVVSNPLNFEVDDMVEFMRALTADSARDLTDVVPVSVPSGSTIDG